MRMGTYGLHNAGLPLAHIRRELFYTPAPQSLAMPPDTAPHLVTLRLRGQPHQFVVQYPFTILQATQQQQGLRLPYSCAGGQCGNCAVCCTQGQVWMSTNEVLTDRELAQGLVLTCTGYPIGGDVHLELG
jgi:ring-1,2-phenylacetyl-CoA epoxidase subunit PaaE